MTAGNSIEASDNLLGLKQVHGSDKTLQQIASQEEWHTTGAAGACAIVIVFVPVTGAGLPVALRTPAEPAEAGGLTAAVA